MVEKLIDCRQQEIRGEKKRHPGGFHRRVQHRQQAKIGPGGGDDQSLFPFPVHGGQPNRLSAVLDAIQATFFAFPLMRKDWTR
jgi:hypothetical protein